VIILHDEQHHTYREHAVPSLRCGGVDSVGMLMCRCAFLHNKHTLPHTCTHTDAHMRGHMLTHTCVRTQTHTHTHTMTALMGSSGARGRTGACMPCWCVSTSLPDCHAYVCEHFMTHLPTGAVEQSGCLRGRPAGSAEQGEWQRSGPGAAPGAQALPLMHALLITGHKGAAI